MARSNQKASLAVQVLIRLFEHNQPSGLPEIGIREIAERFNERNPSTLEPWLGSNQPIQFILPAFPFKALNPDKSLSPLPDAGELIALRRLELLCQDLKTIHPPGAEFTICSDGRVFNDLVGVPDAFVAMYQAGISTIISELKHLRLYSLDDAATKAAEQGTKTAQEWLVEHYSEPVDDVAQELRLNTVAGEEIRKVYCGIKHFLREDQALLHPALPKARIIALCGRLSLAVIRRSRAWGTFLSTEFPKAVRLSIHPQLSSSAKIPIRLIASEDPWRTPWHSMPLFDGKSIRLVRRSVAEGLHANLKVLKEDYPYFAV